MTTLMVTLSTLMALFGQQQLDMEQARDIIEHVEAFCSANWWAGPILVVILSLLHAYNKRRDARNKEQEKEEAVTAARFQAAEEAHAQGKQLTQVTNRQPTPAEKVQKVVKTAIDFGADKWEWNLSTQKLTCIAAGFDKLAIGVTNPIQQSGSLKDVSCYINGDNVNSIIGFELIQEATTLVKAKWVALEDARMLNLANMIGQPSPQAAATITPTFIVKGTETPTVPLNEQDAGYGIKMYDKLVVLLGIKGRWCGPVASDANYYTDNSGITFKTYSPSESEIWVGGLSVMMLFTPLQQSVLSKLCYDRASLDTNRKNSLDQAVTVLDKLYTARG